MKILKRLGFLAQTKVYLFWKGAHVLLELRIIDRAEPEINQTVKIRFKPFKRYPL